MNSTPKNQKLKNALIFLVFVVSAGIGMALLSVAVWGDLEATMFDAAQNGEKRLGTLSCPVLITPQDNAKVSAKFHNPIERVIKPAVRVNISNGYLTFKQQGDIKFELAPDESRKLAWEVNPEDAAYGQMILVKVYLFRNNPIPSKDATCGILVLDVPSLSGKQIVYGSTGLSFIGMLGMVGLWSGNNPLMTKKQTEIMRAMGILTGCIIVGLVFAFLGQWLISGLALIVALLLTVGTISQLLK